MKKSIIIFSLLISIAIINFSCKKTPETVDNKVAPIDFISQVKYINLLIEVDYINGYAPSDESVNNLITFLKQHINKPNGIAVVKKAISVQNTGSYYNLNQVQDIEYANRKMVTSGSTLTAYILYLDKTTNSYIYNFSYYLFKDSI